MIQVIQQRSPKAPQYVAAGQLNQNGGFTSVPDEFQGGKSLQSSKSFDPVGRQLVVHISVVQPLMMSRDASVSRYNAFVWIHDSSPGRPLLSLATRSITRGCVHKMLCQPSHPSTNSRWKRGSHEQILQNWKTLPLHLEGCKHLEIGRLTNETSASRIRAEQGHE